VRIGTSDVLSVALDEAMAIDRAFTLTVGGEATLQIGDVVMLSATKMTLRAVQELRLEVGSSMDDDVREWRYNHEFDNWQDRLGMDSVKVFYHHEHSGMAADGRFVAGMGRTWNDTLQADSSRMSFGDQRLRYLLIHGCDSLQMHFGQNPFRTWAKPKKGARMIFGFDGLTYDVDGTGAGFFREWNTGKSFSQAWQDAALGTLTNHRPASTACGATAEEAQERLWNERLFNGGAVSDSWYWWRWAGPIPIEVQLGIPIPRMPPLNLQLGLRGRDARTAAKLADRFGVRPLLARTASPEPDVYGQDPPSLDGPRLVLLADGSYQAFLAEPDRSAKSVEADSIKAIADRTVREMALDVELTFDGLTATHHAGASRSGHQQKETIGNFSAHYRQLHNGIPAARGGDGHLTITLDPSGKVYAIADRTVRVVEAVEARPSRGSDHDAEASLTKAEKALRRALEDAPCKSHLHVVPDSTDVGYRYDRGSAVAVVRRHVEVRTGDYAIRKILEVIL